MALPKLLQKLFTNGGAGNKLRSEILPDMNYLPTSGGTVNGSVTINGTTVPVSGSTETYKEGIKFGWGSEISQSQPNGLDIWAKKGDSNTVLALYAEAKGDDNGNTPGIYLRAGNGTTTKGLRLTTSAATIDGVEIATLNTASRNLGYTTMVQLGFAKDSTVTLVQFFQKLAEKGYTASNSVLHIGYLYAEGAYVTDGTNTVRIIGGTLYLGQNTHNPSNDYGVAWGFFVPSEGTKLYRFTTYKDSSQSASDTPLQNIYTYESWCGNAKWANRTNLTIGQSFTAPSRGFVYSKANSTSSWGALHTSVNGIHLLGVTGKETDTGGTVYVNAGDTVIVSTDGSVQSASAIFVPIL